MMFGKVVGPLLFLLGMSWEQCKSRCADEGVILAVFGAYTNPGQKEKDID